MNEEIKSLLEHHLMCFANKLGLYEYDSYYYDARAAVRLLNYAERLSRSSIELSDKYKCLLICGLVWEYRMPEWGALKAFITQILIRLHLPVTAKMISWIHQENVFESLGSIFTDIINADELERKEVFINGKSVLLTGFQMRFWESIDEYKYLGVSAPTSAGKSFVVVNKIVSILSAQICQIIYIVPTISLINQVYYDIKEALRSNEIRDVELYQSYSPRFASDSTSAVYILTQERAQAMIIDKKNSLTNLSLLIIDEIQNIERSSGGTAERPRILFDVINAFKNDFNPDKIIVLGPRISNISELMSELFGGKDSGTIADDLPPVLNFTYSFYKVGAKLFIKQYDQLGHSLQLQVNDKTGLIKNIIGGTRYTSKVHDGIASILEKISGESGIIVFSKSSNQATRSAVEIAKSKIFLTLNSDLISLISYVKETVHPIYYLSNTLLSGVAYHHGKVPNHVRWCIEHAFKAKIVKAMVCTSTLLQGVNMPAKYIIVRNPDLGTAKLTGYEFSNLKGRAGRLLKDFIGYTIILDDKSFEDASIKLEFSEEKTIKTSYKDLFHKHEADIYSVIANGERMLVDGELMHLVTHIKQMVLKYEYKAVGRLEKMGIDISFELFETISNEISQLQIDKSICLANPYWNPSDLEVIFNLQKSQLWAEMPQSYSGLSKALLENLKLMKLNFPAYFRRYMNFDITDTILWSICGQAERWAQGMPLRDVIDIPGWPVRTSEDIDVRIDRISTYITFAIPKLLRPLVQIQNIDNPVLSFLESGSYDPFVRALMEIGLSRETAIRVNIRSENIRTEGLSPRELNRLARAKLATVISDENKYKLSEWDILQIKSVY